MNSVLRLLLLIAVLFTTALRAEAAKELKKPARKEPRESTVPVEKAPEIDAAAKPAPPAENSLYDEIAQVLRSRYADPSALNAKKLTQAAIQGLLASLDGSARIVDPDAATPKGSARPAINSVNVLDPFIGYLRLERLDENIASQLNTEIQQLLKEKHVNSIILDLRFSHGTNYASVPAIAGLFFAEAKPLYRIIRGGVTETFDAVTATSPTQTPLVILVNQATREAPEMLSAVLKDQGRALVLGNSATAGQAFETSDVKLSNGTVLRLATGKMALAHGGDIFLKRIEPDVAVTFDTKTETSIWNKPFQAPEAHMEARFYSEAILTGRVTAPPLNKDKKGESAEPSGNGDLVLLRAIDLLKSIQALGISGIDAPASPQG